MNNQRLRRANSFIRDRKERAGIALIKKLINVTWNAINLYVIGSFLTFPNAFKQCTTALLIIHSAIFRALNKNIATA
jgi:hypothetical protein